MTEVKHTPGPWLNLTPDEWSIDTYGENTYYWLGQDGRLPIAAVIVPAAFGMDDLLEANRNLIAAAPGMLEALRKVERILLNRQPDKLPDGLAICRKIIAKAEGRA